MARTTTIARAVLLVSVGAAGASGWVCRIPPHATSGRRLRRLVLEGPLPPSAATRSVSPLRYRNDATGVDEATEPAAIDLPARRSLAPPSSRDAADLAMDLEMIVGRAAMATLLAFAAWEVLHGTSPLEELNAFASRVIGS